MLFPDGHYRRVIFGIGPYIADYPEQVLLSCILTGWCAKYVYVILSQVVIPEWLLCAGVLQILIISTNSEDGALESTLIK